MLEEFARCYQTKTGNKFDVKRQQIRSVLRARSHWSHTDTVNLPVHAGVSRT